MRGPASLRVAALTVVAGVLCACPGQSDCPLDGGPGGDTITISGRVVDFETCMSVAGCQGVERAKVMLFYDTKVVSAPTQANGGFTLQGVPDGVRTHLLVVDSSSSRTHISTLQARQIVTEGKNLFGVETYLLQREGGLYAAMVDELGVSVDDQGLYLGQVLILEDGALKAYKSGASVTSAPELVTRFVRSNPRFDSPPAFHPPTASKTGNFGEFVLISDAETRDVAVLPSANDHTFNPTLAPVGVGYVTVGMHWAEAKSGVTPPADAGVEGG